MDVANKYPRFLNRHYILAIKENLQSHCFEKTIITCGTELDKERAELYAICTDCRKSVKNMLDYINSRVELKLAYESFNGDARYNSLSTAFGGLCDFEYNAFGEKQKWGIAGADLSNLESTDKDIKYKLFKLVFQHIIVYRRDITIKQCLQDANTKFVTHCRKGFSTSEYKISNSIKIILKTNFAYGRSSYLGLVIMYKGLQILPCHDLVLFWHTRITILMNFSKSFPLMPDLDNPEPWGWEAAVNYIVDAVNLASINEQTFIDRYIVSPCEQMVEQFEKWVAHNDFYILDISSDDEINLFAIRAERISSSLKFMNSLRKFEQNHISVGQFIYRIQKCNEQLKIRIEKYLPDIILRIPKCKSELEKLELTRLVLEAKKLLLQNEDGVNQLINTINDVRTQIRIRKRLIENTQLIQQSLRQIRKYIK